MSLPESLKIGPFTYGVCVCPPENALSSADRQAAADHNQLVITIREGLARDAEAEALVHELLHCAVNVSGKPLEFDAEEQAVRVISGPLLDALRRNPDLVAYLTEEG